MKRIIIFLLTVSLLLCFSLSSCSTYLEDYSSASSRWSMGFSSEEIEIPFDTDHPLYIAGYSNGRSIDGVLDIPRANALWIDTGDKGVLLIGIDCVALGSGTVNKIRNELRSFCRKVGCVSVNVYATHTHAGIDTLGLWGDVAVDGKNPDYMEALISSAVEAAKGAYDDRSEGSLYYGGADVGSLLHDSRAPIEFDREIHQLKFISDNESQNGIRLISLSAHAESLRGDNLSVSRDFPGALSDNIKESCGDDVLFMPGAIGGLIMTRELTEPFEPVENMKRTASILTDALMTIDDGRELTPELSIATVPIKLPLDNTFFFFGKFLGILVNKTSHGDSETGYLLHSEVGALSFGEITFALIPGEIFPELVSGNGLSDGDPEPLSDIAARHGIEKLLVIGLCNDEIGYIVPPSDFRLNEELPYIEPLKVTSGENHYEETNSVGPKTSEIIADAFEKAINDFGA